MSLSSFLLLPLLLVSDGTAFARLLPQPAGEPRPQPSVHLTAGTETQDTGEGKVRRADTRRASDWLPLSDSFRPAPARQVRIEHRVIVRIVPLSPARRPDGLTVARTSVPMRIVERPISGCVPIGRIMGVSADRNDRLRLHMRNRQVLSVRFEDQCRTEAFYSGFYVERNGDGLLCPARDAIHSRSGMRCTVGRISHLVAERAD